MSGHSSHDFCELDFTRLSNKNTELFLLFWVIRHPLDETTSVTVSPSESVNPSELVIWTTITEKPGGVCLHNLKNFGGFSAAWSKMTRNRLQEVLFEFHNVQQSYNFVILFSLTASPAVNFLSHVSCFQYRSRFGAPNNLKVHRNEGKFENTFKKCSTPMASQI